MSEGWAQRYAEAADSVFADDFLTGAVAPLVVEVARVERLDMLRELMNRLWQAEVALCRVTPASERLSGKTEGVRLARSYVEELVRLTEGGSRST